MANKAMMLQDTQTGAFMEDEATLMALAHLDPQLGFEAIGMLDDETPIVCDRCGSFGYLDGRRFKIVWVD